MGYDRSGRAGLPLDLVKEFANVYGIKSFIETGTAGGDSVLAASQYFKDCHTIEIIEDRPFKDRKSSDYPKNIKFYTGNAIHILPKILKGIDNSVLFWLDAHYSDPMPNTSDFKECYLLEELDIIGTYCQDCVILIDDARLFLGKPSYPCDPRDWPRIDDVFAKIKSVLPYHVTTIIDDYIVSVNIHCLEVLDNEWANNYSKRYPNESDILKEGVKQVYEAFLKYIE